MPGPEGEEGSDEAIRAFIAIELSDGVRAAVAGVIGALMRSGDGGAVRWSRPENLHVTLRFLGDVPRRRVPEIARSVGLATAVLPPFRMRLGRVGAFPNRRRPRVVALEVGPQEPLAGLARAVDAAVASVGLASDRFHFHPHLTLGRVRGRGLPPVTASVTALGESLVVEEIVLFRSELTNRGARYTPLERIALGGSDHP
ncbi:MAG: RNA 2',3'-cyclic phosphodiesterase [Myxococcota bacterium]